MIDISAVEIVDSLHRADALHDRLDLEGARRRDGRRRHAPGRRDHPGRAGPVAAGRAHGARLDTRARRAARRGAAGRSATVDELDAPVEGPHWAGTDRDGAGPVDELPIRTDDDVVRVRQAVRALASAAQLSLVDQTKLVTAASELARNTLVHGGGGRGAGRDRAARRRARGAAVFTDNGPRHRRRGAGPHRRLHHRQRPRARARRSRRLVDDFELETAVGQGTDGHGDQVDAVIDPAASRTWRGCRWTSRAPSAPPAGRWSSWPTQLRRRDGTGRGDRHRRHRDGHQPGAARRRRCRAAAGGARHDAAAEIEVVAIDRVPASPTWATARRDGSSTAGTLGIGLGAIDRMADSVEIATVPERGTVLVAAFDIRRRRPVAAAGRSVDAAGITRALDGRGGVRRRLRRPSQRPRG